MHTRRPRPPRSQWRAMVCGAASSAGDRLLGPRHTPGTGQPSPPGAAGSTLGMSSSGNLVRIFERASSTSPLPREGLLAAAALTKVPLLRLRARFRKGLSHLPLPATAFRIPVEALPQLAACRSSFETLRPSTGDPYYALEGAPPLPFWLAEVQPGWLTSALAACGLPVPDTRAWPSPSLRFLGAASVATTGGLALLNLHRYLAGWAATNSVPFQVH